MNEELDNENVSDGPDELTLLKERADLMGISYRGNIGIAKLKEKILNHTEPSKKEEPEEVTEEVLTAQRHAAIRNDALKLIRIRVTCMNPMKQAWPGEFFCVSNRVIGEVKKFVPFNAEEGWHVPNVILTMLRERRYQTFYTVKENGRKVKRTKLAPEFGIEVLNPLTDKELKDLAQRQAMSGSIED